MEVIKRIINREELISRDQINYGKVVKPYIYINLSLTQSIDDIGIYTDYPLIEKIIANVSKTTLLQGLRPNYNIRAWYQTGKIITADVDSILNDLKGYKDENRFKVNFDISKGTYLDFQKKEINGVTRITSKDDISTTYVIDGNNDGYLGGPNQTTGLRYVDTGNKTQVSFKAQGVNETNSSLSAISKEEYLLGIISTPEIKNDVFINRGQNTVLNHHLRLSEIETLDHLVNYGNGYYNVTR